MAACGDTAITSLPAIGVTTTVCARTSGHTGSHHDPAYEVYWSANQAGVTVHLPSKQAEE